jgi:hypothetical protein
VAPPSSEMIEYWTGDARGGPRCPDLGLQASTPAADTTTMFRLRPCGPWRLRVRQPAAWRAPVTANASSLTTEPPSTGP